MKKILLFIQLFAFFIAYGVPPSWNVNKDGIKMQLNFNSNTIGIEENNIINTDLKKKYQIGVFIIRENKEICLGYMSYDANSTTSLTIWGLPQKDIKNTLYLRLWDTVTNCEITNVKAVLTANNVELIYRPNDTLIMQKLVFTKSPDIFYADTYCSNVIIKPTIESSSNNLKFISSNPLISIDETNGIITPLNLKNIENTSISIYSDAITCDQKIEQKISILPVPTNTHSEIITCSETTELISTETNNSLSYKWLHNSSNEQNTNVIDTGIYVLEKTLNICIGYDTFDVIYEKLNIESISLINENCTQKGEIIIDKENVIANNKKSLTFQLNDEISPQGNFKNLSKGLYLLQIRKNTNCLFTHSFKIENECKSTNENILIPHLNGYSSFPINSNGTVKIYNRNGVLIKTLVGENQWNGTNEQKQIVPIGLYFIVEPNGKRISVTVLD